jgi:hypothetical protein
MPMAKTVTAIDNSTIFIAQNTMARSFIRNVFSEIFRIGSSRPIIWYPYHEGFILLWKENKYNPLMLECLLNPEIMHVAGRIRKYVVNEMRKKRRR